MIVRAESLQVTPAIRQPWRREASLPLQEIGILIM